MIPVMLGKSIYPRLKRAEDDPQSIYKGVRDFLRLSIGISLFVFIAFFFLGEPIFLFFFGTSFVGSSDIVLYGLPAYFFVSLGIMVNCIVMIHRKFSLLAKTSLFAALINFTLNLFMIPLLGLKGAIFATVITQVFATYLLLYIFSDGNEVLRIIHSSVKLK